MKSINLLLLRATGGQEKVIQKTTIGKIAYCTHRSQGKRSHHARGEGTEESKRVSQEAKKDKRKPGHVVLLWFPRERI